MCRIDIAMATYNGEQFIEEQIKSIQAQSYRDWCLFISDDGSNDNTIKIVMEIQKLDSRVKLINVERQGGVIQNFNKALESTSAEYVVLCDQDDIWPNDRLEIMFDEIKGKEKSKEKGIMLFTDLELIDETGNVIADSFYHINRINPLKNLEPNKLLWNCTIYGCTTIVNRALLNKSLPISSNALMHDQWLALKANQDNGLYFINKYKSILYRQHSNNVVGGSNHGFFSKLKKIKKNLSNIKKSVISIKKNLYGNNGLYGKNNSLTSNMDFIKFAFVEIFPEIFKGDRKLHVLFLFIGFIIIK